MDPIAYNSRKQNDPADPHTVRPLRYPAARRAARAPALRAALCGMLLLLPMALLPCGCTAAEVAGRPPSEAATSAPTSAPTSTPAPVPLAGTWTAEIDGIALTLTLYPDGRYEATLTENAGTVRTENAQGTYTAAPDGMLCFSNNDVLHDCTAHWTETTLTVEQTGFSALTLTRAEETK